MLHAKNDHSESAVNRVILVTGANGFVGSALIPMLKKGGYVVRPVVRAMTDDLPGVICVGDINGTTAWTHVLENVDTVIHLAARVHMVKDTATDPLAAFREVNRDGTVRLAKSAIAAGVRRFIFISSIKVHGEETVPQNPYHEQHRPQPADPYGLSKWEAEQCLWEIAAASPMEITVIRPPLVYGAGVGANFLRLIELIDRELPLPIGATGNKRSLINVYNLTDVINRCIDHPNAAGQTFLVSDGVDLSTTELAKRIASALNRHPLLLPIPARMVSLLAKLIGKQVIVRRLWGSLTLDSSHVQQTLNWTPPQSVDEGINAAVETYLKQKYPADAAWEYGSLTRADLRRTQTVYARYGKRGLDILISAILILLLLPLFVLVWLIIRLESPGAAIFTQQRAGYKKVPFTIYKFRSMVVQKRDPSTQAYLDDPRITRVGYVIRRLKIDEFPQLFNILLGDMSLVGPRPTLIMQTKEYTPEQHIRYEVLPGLTGWAQVNGNIMLSVHERREHDVWYVQHLSFWLDMRIVLMTVAVVLFGEKPSK